MQLLYKYLDPLHFLAFFFSHLSFYCANWRKQKMVYLRYLALTALTAVLNVQASVISDYSSEYFSKRVSERVSQYVSEYALPTNLPGKSNM